MKNYISKILLAASVVLASCGEEQEFFQQFSKTDNESIRLRFVHAASDTVGVNLFLNNQKISGAAQSILSTGQVNVGRINFGGDFPITGYTTLVNGSGNLSVIFPETYTTTTTYAAKTMSTVNSTLAAPKWYTVAFIGVSPNYETKIYEDDMHLAPIDGKAYLRFASFIDNLTDPVKLVVTPPATTEDPNPNPITLFENVNYKTMTGFIALPQTGTYKTLQLINQTTGSVLFTLSPATSTLYTYVDNKAYTLFARGRIGGTGSAAPAFGRMLNR